MKTRKRELAKVGIFGSIDNPTIVTEKDLREIAETFPQIKKAPVKLGGHWTEDRPRLAAVVAVDYDEASQTLTGTVEEQDALAEAVDAGFYPDVSIGAKARATDGKMYLHHLAYLGDEPPAVKDLVSNLAEHLSEPDGDTGIAAADSGTVRLFPGTAEKRLYLSESFEGKRIENTTGTGSASGEPPSPGAEPFLHHKEESMTEEEIKTLQAENARLKAENEAKEKLLSDSVNKQKTAEKEQLKAAAQGKLPEAELTKLLALADSFENGKTIELSDGETKKTVSPVSMLADVFAKIPLPVEPGVINLSDDDKPSAVETINFSAI